MQKNIKKVQKMNKLINNIISYLQYLNSDCNLKVSIHFDMKTFVSLPKLIVSKILPYNTHTNSYCVKIKGKEHNKCLQNQKTILEKCHEDEFFCHICHAGVYEYIYPIFKNSNAVGFIAISGYRKKQSYNNSTNKDLWETALDKNEMPIELFNKIIPPLAIMLEQLVLIYSKDFDNEFNLIIQFLNEYHSNITLSDLSKKFNRSNSHISHLFKKECGMTIRAYCNILKLKDAETLLLNTDLPVSEIAYDTGFNDVSYFIHTFKKYTGISPLRYRKINQ